MSEKDIKELAESVGTLVQKILRLVLSNQGNFMIYDILLGLMLWHQESLFVMFRPGWRIQTFSQR